ncbi:MAG: ABC transporter permease, partial [Candidatus Acidiferrales bacterium]
MGALWNDLRHGIRMLAKNPGFTAIAVLTLALGIGANTAIFSVVDGVLLHPLPFPNSGRLVWVWGNFARSGEAAVSPPDFLDYRAQNHVFEHFGAAFVAGTQPENLSVAGHGQQVQGTMVTSGLFGTLGAKPLFGRSFVLSDEQVVLPQVIILSYRLWQEKFGADPGIVGRSVESGGASATVVGVMPPSFNYPPQTDIWY